MNTDDRQLISEVSGVMKIIGAKWKPEILYTLVFDGRQRFSEIQRQIPEITQRMLTARLRELERDGLIERTVYPEVPVRVEYEVTELGKSVDPCFRAMSKWISENKNKIVKANKVYD